MGRLDVSDRGLAGHILRPRAGERLPWPDVAAVNLRGVSVDGTILGAPCSTSGAILPGPLAPLDPASLGELRALLDVRRRCGLG